MIRSREQTAHNLKTMQTSNKFASAAGASFRSVTQAIIIVIIVLQAATKAATANEEPTTLTAAIWPGQRNAFPGENLSSSSSSSASSSSPPPLPPLSSNSISDGQQLIGPPLLRQKTATRLPDEHQRPTSGGDGGGGGLRFPAISRLSELLASLGPRASTQTSGSSSSSSSQESRNLASFVAEPSLTEAPAAAASKGPPIYRSAPKQIIEVHEEHQPQPEQRQQPPPPPPPPLQRANKRTKASKSVAVVKVKKSASERSQTEPLAKRTQLSPADLNSAAGYHHDHHQQSARKQTQIKMKKKKTKRKKHAYPAQYTYFGKYHEHRSVPAKGAWEFGYKRGNAKHTIEREEHGHKSHFKTEVKWKDKKGKGHHVFDYNHGDHKKRAYPAAAAASVTQQRKSQPSGGGGGRSTA